MTQRVSRHFVTLDGRWGTRQVHYRRAGNGPLLLMLHQSPQSSRELVPLMEQWGESFTIVAPDSPGYGLSDPLALLDTKGDEAELGDFADATIEFMDALGAGRFGIYGFHTGGMIGIAIAHAYPDRVTAFACNGVAVPTDDELDDILAAYFPHFEPQWDGGHLAWLWARLREQTIFFPWHNRTLAGRMDFPMPAPEHQQNSVLELLRAGEHYAVAYRAAFVFHAERVVPELRVPGLITAGDWDPLQDHLARLPEPPDCVQVIPSETLEESLQRCFDHARAYVGDALPAAPTTTPAPNRLWRQVVATAAGECLVTCGGPATSPPVLVLHGAGGSGSTVAPVATGLAQTRAAFAIDLPGHGESDYDVGAGGVTVEACADAVLHVLTAMNLQTVDVVGDDGGALIALELATRHANRVGRLALVNPPKFNPEQVDGFHESGLPSLAPDWFGGHLLRCWHMVRDSRLYFPWFQRDQAGILWRKPDLDDRRIQAEVTDYLKAEGAWQQLLHSQLAYPLRDRLRACGEGLTVCAARQSPWFENTEVTANKLKLPFAILDGDRDAWGEQIAAVHRR